MEKVLLVGATGNLGRQLLRELKQQGYFVRVLVRSAAKAAALVPAPDETVVADAAEPATLANCCENIDVVISALGKSISLNDTGKTTFQDIDFKANVNLLREAKRANVKQFVYISAYTAALNPHLAYFKAHADFAEALCRSGIAYTILEPTALFSAFSEVAAMARKGQLGVLGKGDKRTNPIFEGDVATHAVAAIGQASQVIPLGGKQVYTRLELMQLAVRAAGVHKTIPHVPFALVDMALPVMKLFSRNIHDKVAFLAAVSRVDCVAPQVGDLTLEAYFQLAPQTV